MRILCVDVGTGTQDILLYDSDKGSVAEFVAGLVVDRRVVVARWGGGVLHALGLSELAL